VSPLTGRRVSVHAMLSWPFEDYKTNRKHIYFQCFPTSERAMVCLKVPRLRLIVLLMTHLPPQLSHKTARTGLNGDRPATSCLRYDTANLKKKINRIMFKSWLRHTKRPSPLQIQSFRLYRKRFHKPSEGTHKSFVMWKKLASFFFRKTRCVFWTLRL
jgi:hypothetical protein